MVQRLVRGLGSRRSFLEFDGKELARLAARRDAPQTDSGKVIRFIFENETARALRERPPVRSAAKYGEDRESREVSVPPRHRQTPR